jgi:glycosyltransferase involved in cell wall biosynthesis
MELGRAQVAHGHRVVVAAADTAGWREGWHGVELRGVRALPWARLRLGRRRYDLARWLPLALEGRRGGYDIVHVHELVRFSPLGGRIRVAHFHTDPRWDDTPHSLRAQRPDFRRIARETDAQLTVSAFVGRRLREGMRGSGVPDDSCLIEVIPNGLDLRRFDPGVLEAARARLRAAWGMRGDDVVLLFAGAWVPEKGLEHLASALSALLDDLPRVHLVVAGGAGMWGQDQPAPTAQRTHYEANVVRLLEQGIDRSRVRFLGMVPGAEMPGLHAAADVLVQPSVFQEAFGLSILEGMAGGSAIIATTVGGVPELVRDGENGFLVPPADPVALKEAIRRLAGDPALRTRLGERGRQLAKSFTWDASARRVEAVCQAVSGIRSTDRREPSASR